MAGRAEGAGWPKGAPSVVNRALVRELKHTSGPDFAARLSAVTQDPGVSDAVKTQAAMCLAAVVFAVARFPNMRTIRRLEGNPTDD